LLATIRSASDKKYYEKYGKKTSNRNRYLPEFWEVGGEEIQPIPPSEIFQKFSNVYHNKGKKIGGDSFIEIPTNSMTGITVCLYGKLPGRLLTSWPRIVDGLGYVDR
jgi:hypothetical protein